MTTYPAISNPKRSRPMHEQEIIRCGPLCLELSWRSGLLTRLCLRWSTPEDNSRFFTPWSASLCKWLHQYLTGTLGGCPEIPLDWNNISGFSRRVLSALQTQVPAGQWISYGGLAERSGCPGAARAVGKIMASNPWPLIVPCHRVLGSAGQLTGYGGGLDIKWFLLKKEGIQFSASGKAAKDGRQKTGHAEQVR